MKRKVLFLVTLVLVSLMLFSSVGFAFTSVPVKGISLSAKSMTMVVNQTSTLTALITPSNATSKMVNWSSSNSTIAKVNAKGLVTALKPGEATITVKTADKKFSATCKITVIKQLKNATVTWWEYPRFNVPGKENGIYENEIVSDFTKINPTIKVRVEMITFNAGPEKINTAIAANAMPDLIFDYPGRIAGYSTQNALVPLDDMLSVDIKDDISPALLSHCIYGNKLYMYPICAAAVFMGVNKTIFDQIGATNLLPLDKPGRAWTIDDFAKALDAVKTKAKDVQPAVMYAKNEQGDASIRMFIQNFGADFMDKDHKNVILNSDAGVKGLTWIVDAYKKGYFAMGAESTDSSTALDMFYQGKSAFSMIFSPGNLTIYKTGVKDGKYKQYDLRLIPIPHPSGTDPKVEVQVQGFCVFDNKDDAKAAAAKRLIDYICNAEKYQKQNVIATGNLPVRDSLTGLYSDSEVAFAQTMLKYTADTGYTAKNYAQIRAKFYPMMQSVLIEKVTPKAGLDQFAKDATALLN